MTNTDLLDGLGEVSLHLSGTDYAQTVELSASTIQSLQQEVKRLREALRPFSHPDLCARLGGNVQGNDSIIFGRNKAKITLGDCRKAAALLSTEGGE